jgi:hypothetical protein
VHGNNAKNLHVYLYLKLAKKAMFFFISYVFSSTKLENKKAEQVLPEAVCVVVGQTMHTHVSK